MKLKETPYIARIYARTRVDALVKSSMLTMVDAAKLCGLKHGTLMAYAMGYRECPKEDLRKIKIALAGNGTLKPIKSKEKNEN